MKNTEKISREHLGRMGAHFDALIHAEIRLFRGFFALFVPDFVYIWG